MINSIHMRIVLFSIFLLTHFTLSAQFLSPVKWSTSFEKVSENEYNLIFTADIDAGWYVYSQYLESQDGPIPTTFTYEEGSHFQLIDKNVESGHKKEGFDEIFQMNVTKFQDKVTFTQKVLVNDPNTPIKGYLEFMTCDNERCLPPTEEEFSFMLSENTKTEVAENSAKVETPSEENILSFEELYGTATPNMETPAGNCGDNTELKKAGIWKIFFLGFLGGLIALLTPCVFPMIPLTVSYFTKGSEKKSKSLSNATYYGLFIFLIYLLLSFPFHIMNSLDADILNQVSTNEWLNIAFFAIFLYFSFSFFGFYEITLPSSWTNRSSSAESIGGLLGIFFMALTLALVSFSCTGPILGSLLAGALTSDGGAWQLTAGMGGFGLALALPFGVFAAFPGMMKALPKSGGWLNTVKVSLGFLELALAFKFLSNADLVKHWGLLKIEPFLAIWIIIALGWSLYLFGWIKFPHDSPTKKLSIARIGFGFLSLGLAIYLAFGFKFNQETKSFQPLTLLSGLAPPACYSWFYPCDCPQGLNCFKDFSDGMNYAKKTNKPVLVDFTGYACVNCRKMEEHVWPNAKVYSYLINEYVLISLYVDDKKELPETEQKFIQKINGEMRQLRNYGHKWSNFQEFFGANSQPYYVLLSPEGEILSTPVGYTPNPDKYASFLECGLNSFKRVSKNQ